MKIFWSLIKIQENPQKFHYPWKIVISICNPQGDGKVLKEKNFKTP